MNTLSLFQDIAAGRRTPEEALAQFSHSAAELPLDCAHIDLDRFRRRGIPETIFCPGKSIEQLLEICTAMQQAKQNIMATRISPQQAAALTEQFPDCVHHETARLLTLDPVPLPPQQGNIAILSAGTADIPVAEEARLTAERMGAHVSTFYDVGVAGLHRLLRRVEAINSARAVIVVAGMEGALPSVVAGLVNKPLIAVPTSIGYGLSMEGLTALLAMLNSCAAGVTVVNIDNGFGAGVAAAMINRLGRQ